MNLYLISQNENNNYDTFDSAVVAASSYEEAKNIHPFDYPLDNAKWKIDNTWASSPDNVNVLLIGKASPEIYKPCVIIASFNAG